MKPAGRAGDVSNEHKSLTMPSPLLRWLAANIIEHPDTSLENVEAFLGNNS